MNVVDTEFSKCIEDMVSNLSGNNNSIGYDIAHEIYNVQNGIDIDKCYDALFDYSENAEYAPSSVDSLMS